MRSPTVTAGPGSGVNRLPAGMAGRSSRPAEIEAVQEKVQVQDDCWRRLLAERCEPPDPSVRRSTEPS